MDTQMLRGTAIHSYLSILPSLGSFPSLHLSTENYQPFYQLFKFGNNSKGDR